MKKLFTPLVLVICITSSFAQVRTDRDVIDLYHLKKELKQDPKEIREAQGSPYVYENFTLGNVYFKNSESFSEFLLNLNAHTDQIEFKEDSYIYNITNLEEIDKFVINNETIYQIAYMDKKDSANGFFVELFGNDISLYKKYRINYFKPRQANTAFESDTPARFVEQDPHFYISINNQPAFRIKGKKSLKEFADDPSLKSFLNKNKINFNSEEDLIKLVEFLNQI